MKLIGLLITLFITMIIGPIWRGYALTKLWLWFVVSTFGVVPLGVAQAIGLGFVVSILSPDIRPQQKDDRVLKQKAIESISMALFLPAFGILFGWIVKQWL